jgi:hypothetical protein
MPLGLGIFTLQPVLAAAAPLGLDRDHHRHLLHRDQRPRVPLVARLPTGSTPTGVAARAFGRLGRVRRGRLGGIMRVAPQPLGQLFDSGFQRRDFRPQLGQRRGLRQDHLLRHWRRLIPYLWR